MADVLRGRVSKVIDGDTFELSGISATASEGRRYNATETIRIASIDAPELNTAAGKRSKEALEGRIGGRNVTCTVSARDVYGRVVASVRVG
ncbi:MAG: thermonuclease family protein [Betaproteobacteria bacterium]